MGVWLASNLAACGQGQFYFVNRSVAPAIDSPVFDALGARLEGPDYLVQLFVARPGETLQPVGEPIGFFRPGYFNGGIVTVPYPPGTDGDCAEKRVDVQIRAWRVGAGATYTEAAQSLDPDPRGNYGHSEVLSPCPGGPFNPDEPSPFPTYFITLSSFRLVAVPEPSALVLGAMGAVLWLLRRRSG